MNKKLWILYIVFIDFVIFTGYVVYQDGYLGFVEMALGSLWGAQVFIDLVIALLMFVAWMFADAKQRGVNPWPYFIGTLFLGSIVPLWYLIRREHSLQSQA